MKHALVVGGSGMLAKTSLWLADNGYLVSIIGRSIQRLSKLSSANKNIIPLPVDYNNEQLLRSTISKSITLNGPYDLVVAWIHNNEKQIIDIISSEIRRITNKEWLFFASIKC